MIVVKAKSVYGRTLYYPTGDAATALKQLTGKVTIDHADMEALKSLGVNIIIEDLPL